MPSKRDGSRTSGGWVGATRPGNFFQREMEHADECTYIFELKYTAKAKATKEKIASLKKEAIDQIEMYKTAIEFRDKQVKAYAMIFAGSECIYCA